MCRKAGGLEKQGLLVTGRVALSNEAMCRRARGPEKEGLWSEGTWPSKRRPLVLRHVALRIEAFGRKAQTKPFVAMARGPDKRGPFSDHKARGP